MSNATGGCPGRDELRAFVLGSQNERTVWLESHLLDCDACAAALEEIEADDELVDELRRARTVVMSPSPVLDELVVRMKERAPAALGDTVVAASQTTLTGLLAPPRQPDEMGRLGPYRVLGVLGHGGMGVVFRAEDSDLGRPVALKVLQPQLLADPGARQRFFHEARAAGTLRHDHIVTVYQVGEDRGVPFLAMELLEGESLAARLGREPILPLAEGVRLATQTAEALAAAHERGVVHRDIKPENLWLESHPAGRVKVLDFGLARLTAGVGRQNATHPGVVLGTPAYMAPEQIAGEPSDHRADLFSLGVVLYRTVTGVVPFQGDDVASTLWAVMTKPPSPPTWHNPALPAKLSALILRLLEKGPDKRPESAVAVLALLGNALSPPPARRRRLLWLALLPLALVGGLVLYFGSRGSPHVPPPTTSQEPVVRFEADEVDQRIAEWVLRHEGNLETLDDLFAQRLVHRVLTADRLPKSPFHVLRLAVTLDPSSDAELEELIALLEQRQHLESIYFARKTQQCRFPTTGVLRSLSRVKSLNKISCGFGQARRDDIAALQTLPLLHFLTLDNSALDDTSFAGVGALSRLDQIMVNNCAITDAGLAVLPDLKRLRQLYLNADRLTDASVDQLQRVEKLESLDLMSVKLTDGVWPRLARCVHLKSLRIGSGKAITGEGIAALAKLPALESLRVDNTQLNDDALVQLASSRLKSLKLVHTRVTAAGVAQLRQTLPDCVITLE